MQQLHQAITIRDDPNLRNKPELQAEVISFGEEYIDPSHIENTKLIAIAQRVVRQRGIINPPNFRSLRRGIINPPNFRSLRNSDIHTFIESYSPVYCIPKMSC